jgi:hypothetical protein
MFDDTHELDAKDLIGRRCPPPFIWHSLSLQQSRQTHPASLAKRAASAVRRSELLSCQSRPSLAQTQRGHDQEDGPDQLSPNVVIDHRQR